MDLSEVQLKAELVRAQQARELLEHELMREAFTTLRERIISEWEASPSRDTSGRETLWLTLRILASVEGHLKGVMETGKLASVKLEQNRTLMQKAKEVVGWAWQS